MKDKALKHILQNWKAGLTVSLVSIPLALALTIASGGSPTQGIITAFAAGVLGAIFGGSHFNIIGPTGALSGILISYSIIYGSSTLPVVAIVAGILILVAYLLNFDKYIIFIPRSVVHGFTFGVALIIALGQVDNIFGLQNIRKGMNVLVNTWHSLQHINQTNYFALIIFLVSIVFILLWNKKFPKMPGAVLIALISIFFVFIKQQLNLPVSITTLGDKFPRIHATLFDNFYKDLSITIFLQKRIWMVSLAVAVIAILETLLSGQIAQNITKIKFDRKKEILGLSIANIGSGLCGGIPATAALARTALNIKSGAKHRTSGIINGILVGIIALFLIKYFSMLPMAVIAAILFSVAMGMVEADHFRHFWQYEKTSFYIALVVAGVTLVEDPVVGILLGTTISLILFVNNISKGQTEILLWKDQKMTESILKDEFVKKEQINSDIVVYKISGTLTYINMPAHLETATKIKGNKYVILSVRHVFYADTDGIEYLTEIIEVLKNQNDKIYVSGINKEIEKFVQNEEFYKNKLVEGKIFARTSEAINEILKK